MTARPTINVNTQRELWASSGGRCQNPSCNKKLLREVEGDTVSLANVAHIIGFADSSPRNQAGLARYIEKNGIDNLIMLCLECHKIVDELERRFGIDQLRKWKDDHTRKISSAFSKYQSERDLLIEVNRLVEENHTIFSTLGPHSQLAISGEGGDAIKLWKRRRLDTVIPNNDRIIRLIEAHNGLFGLPWDVGNALHEFKLHATAFEDNCFAEDDDKINDYPTFPSSFSDLIKRILDIPVRKPPHPAEEIEIRERSVEWLIEKVLPNLGNVASVKDIGPGLILVERIKGEPLRAFVTNNYIFSEYTYDKVMRLHLDINTIVCTFPYGTITSTVKERALNENIGIFSVSEFMGALRFEGEKFLNYLGREDRNERINFVKKRLEKLVLPTGCEVYLHGSFLRQYYFNDVDLVFVYPNRLTASEVETLVNQIKSSVGLEDKLHLEVCSKSEYPEVKMKYDNRKKVK